jgi:dienelactone hydrolase
MKWLPNHLAEQTRPPLDKVIAWLKEQGVKEFGAIGYCFGGQFLILQPPDPRSVYSLRHSFLRFLRPLCL